jgi:hypothetical protein
MPRWTLVAFPALALLLAVPRTAPSCSLCNPDLRQAPTFREEAANPAARMVLAGTVRNPRLGPGGTGVTDFHITHVLRPDPFLGDKKVLELPRYLAGSDPKNPPRFLIFCDVFMGQLDPFRGVPIKSADAVDYARKAIALNPRDPAGNLLFFFRYLEHPDPEVARDAFLEFAKASDREVAEAARKLSPDKLRGWIKDPQLPPERLSVYAVLLGACGGAEDAALLGGLLQNTDERVGKAYEGILAGYMQLRPRDGWDLALALLRDGSKPLPVRLAAVRTLRFQYGARPGESRANVLRGLAAMLAQGELADLAVEDLRGWQMWDLTREVLALYGKRGYDAPLMQRAIVRYALSCKDNACLAFLAERRRQEPDLVREVEEMVAAYERQK